MLFFNKAYMRDGAFGWGILILAGITLSATAVRSETLPQALQRTVSTNSTISAERYKQQSVAEGLNIVRDGFGPQVGLDGDIGRNWSYDDPNNAPDGHAAATSLGYAVRATYPIYLGGRKGIAIDKAQTDILAADESLRNVKQSILLETALTYVDVVRDQSIKNLRESNLDLLGEQLRATKDRLKAGVVTATDVSSASSRQSAAKSNYLKAKAGLRASRAEYRRLTGRAPSRLSYPPVGRKLPAGNMSSAIKKGKASNPLILKTLYERDALRHALQSIKSERKPEVNLNAGFNRRWSGHGSHGYSKHRDADVRLNFKFSLYDGGVLRGRVRQARLNVRQKEREVDAARSRVRSDVEASWEAMMAAKASKVSAADQISSAADALAGIRNEEAVGQRTVLDVLDGERELLVAKEAAENAKADYLKAYFRLLKAMGRMTTRP